MPDTVTLEIDGQTITVPTGTTLLNAAALAGTTVPTICYHNAQTAQGVRRAVLVVANGGNCGSCQGSRVQQRCAGWHGNGLAINFKCDCVRHGLGCGLRFAVWGE